MDRDERIERLFGILRGILEDYRQVRVSIHAETDDGRYPHEEGEEFAMSFVFRGEGAAEVEQDDE